MHCARRLGRNFAGKRVSGNYTRLRPDTALKLVEIPEPAASHMLTPGQGVLVEVHAAGVSFPELLQTRGEYQMKPPLPFVPGSEVGGVVISAPDGADVKPGDRVAAFCALGYAAEAARRTRAAASSSETRPWATSNSRIEVVCGARLG